MELHHVELYSGVGGMRLGVSSVLPSYVRHKVKAFDVNINANRVYQHNFRDSPCMLSLEHCTAADLHIKQTRQRGATAASIDMRTPLLWTLSPPCQPYTTTVNSRQADAADTRATSFGHILDLMPSLKRLPTHFLLENVVSFYGSTSHQQLQEVLQQLGYHMFDVMLCPSQLGIPHFRPRHYTLAKLQQSGEHIERRSFSQDAAAQLQELQHDKPRQQVLARMTFGHHEHTVSPHKQQHVAQADKLQSHLQLDWSQQLLPLCECDADIQQQVARYALPLSKVQRYFKVLDIVTPTMSQHSNCFTKAYGRNILGTGSYILEDCATQQLASRDNRGRFHFKHDPYRSQQLWGSASDHICDTRTFKSFASSRESVLASTEWHTPMQAVAQTGPSGYAATAQQLCSMEGLKPMQIHNRAVCKTPVNSTAAPQSYTDMEAQIPPVLRVRRFTPREVASLQGFPSWFGFPDHFTDMQAYALLGNSLSINAVSYLLQLLLEDVALDATR